MQRPGSSRPSRAREQREHRGGGREEGPGLAGRWGGTHLSVKSSGRSGGCRVREGSVGNGRGQLRGVERVGSPRLRGRWDQSCSSQVIYTGGGDKGTAPQQPALGTRSGLPTPG